MAKPARGAYPDPNGRIAFETTIQGNLDIFAMGLDGSGRVNLTNDPSEDRDPVWSPDGCQIAFVIVHAPTATTTTTTRPPTFNTIFCAQLEVLR